MYFTQYYLDCLSQASYLIGDEATGQAVVVDPRRDVEEYLADAAAHGLTIVGVINTHFHADFLAGHLELAAATGAWIGYGQPRRGRVPDPPPASTASGSRSATSRWRSWRPPATPRSRSACWSTSTPPTPVPYGVLTGDALFIGDVGRPDLLASIGVDRRRARPDAVRLDPAQAHGACPTRCGSSPPTAPARPAARTSPPSGSPRSASSALTNYACQPMSEEDFLALVTAGQPAAPEYFVYDAILNREQPRPARTPTRQLAGR